MQHAKSIDGDSNIHLSDYVTRLRRMVEIQMGSQLRSRLDPEDIVQDALAEATRRWSEFCENQTVPVYVWLRRIASQKIIDARRYHFAGIRHPQREECLRPLPGESAAFLANQIAESGLTPSADFRKKEGVELIRRALAEITDRHRELLIWKFVEEMNDQDIAAMRQISDRQVRRQRIRALESLRKALKLLGWESET